MKTMKTLSRRMAALFLVVVVGLTALAPAASAAAIQLPSLPKDKCVVDDAGVLSDSTTTELETINAQLSASCNGAQIGVLTVDYTGSATTEDYATAAFNAWGIGSASKNNGVLILLVMQSAQYADGDYYLTYGDGFRSTMLADQASTLVQTMKDDFAAKKYDAAVLTCATNVANTIAEVYGVTLSGGTISPDGSAVPNPSHPAHASLGNIIGGLFELLAYIIVTIALFFVFITPSATPLAGTGVPSAGSAHGGAEAPVLRAALTMTSAPAAVSTAAVPAAREARAGLGLPVEAVSEALAVWAAAPVSAELAAAAAALAAWAAAAATAAAQDADAEHFLILNRATSAADAISYHICRAGVIFCLFLLRPSILPKPCLPESYAR